MNSSPHPVVLTVLAMLLLTTTSACSDGSAGDGTLTVLAAASLTDAFGEIETSFEASHPGVDVEISLAASSTLREQILEGAPADVYASADPRNMDLVVAAGAASDPIVFARNRMQIAVPSGNPGGITDLSDLGRPELLIGLCAPQVPCGSFGREVLAAAGIVPSVDTDEPTVRFLLTKIEAGELDAGLVYRTDVASADGVAGIDIPEDWNVDARYPIAVVTGTAWPGPAAAFVDFVLAAEGREILSQHGFLAP